MKLQFKTLSRAVFSVEAEPSEKVIDLKKKVAEIQGFDVERQNLIFKGKILSDDTTVEECHFSEKDFIVVMEMKKKKAPAAAAPKPSASTSEQKKEEPKAEEKKVEEKKAEEPKAEEKAKEEEKKEEKKEETTSAQAPAAAETTSSQPASSNESYNWEASGSVLVTGEAYQQAVNNLVEMGFEKDQVIKAMRASFNNPDRAAEYLMTGIPEHLLPQDPPAQPAAQAPAPAQGAAQPAQGAAAATPAGNQPVNLFEAAANAARPARTGTAPAGQNNLSFLNNNPQFQRLRELIHSNPQLLQPLLQQLGQSNPELMEVISSNPEAFVRLLEEGMGEGQQGEGNPLGGGAVPIQISQEEAEAISRLEALGFERSLVIEAYFACDKNEELAANYLFNTQNENWD